VTIFGTVIPSTEVNEQLTDDDLLSFVKNQETALQDNIILPVLVNWMPTWLTVTRITACSLAKKTLPVISFQNCTSCI